MPDEEKPEQENAPEGEGSPEEKPENPPENKDAKIKQLEADKAALNKALHNERKNKGSDEAAKGLSDKLQKLEAELEKERKIGLVSRFSQDKTEQEVALGYFEKLAVGVTDAEERAKLMARAVALVRQEKNGSVDELARATSTMHAGGRGSTANSDGPTPSTVAMGRVFGISEEKLKQADRRPKNIYN